MEEEFFEEPSNVSEKNQKNNKVKGVLGKLGQNKYIAKYGGYLQAGGIIVCALGAFYLMFSKPNPKVVEQPQVQNQEQVQAQEQIDKEPTKTIDEVKERIQNDLEKKYSEPEKGKENLASTSSQNIEENNTTDSVQMSNMQMDNEKLENICLVSKLQQN